MNLRVTVMAPINEIPNLGPAVIIFNLIEYLEMITIIILQITRDIPQSAVGVQITNCFVPNGLVQ